MTSAVRSTAAPLWFLAGALLAALAMQLGPVREVRVEEPIIIRAEISADPHPSGSSAPGLLGP